MNNWPSFWITASIALLSSVATAQTNLCGFVSDAITRERLVGATIMVESSRRGTTTNAYGFFSLPALDSSCIALKVSYLGYHIRVVKWTRNEDGSKPLAIFLTPSEIQSQEIVVSSDRQTTKVISTSMGIVSIPVKQVLTLPSVGGEVDLLKAVQLQSGVTSGQEWSNGIYVRGGSFDENLFLLDGVTIYNPNHIFGFYSIYNTDAVKDVELIKGGIPAQYGGRLSSVLSFILKDGSLEKTTWKGGISLIASRISIEGPLSDEGKGSYIVSARRSYFDKLLWALGGFKGKNRDYYCYDLVAKANYILNENDRVFFSGYFGRDNFNHGTSYVGADIFSMDFSWGNQAYSARWNHLWSSSLFSNISIIYSDYHSDQKTNYRYSTIQKEPAVKDICLKFDGELFMTENQSFHFGTVFIGHHFRISAGILQNNGEVVTKSAQEVQNYVSHDWQISNRVNVTGGVRCDYFSTIPAFEFDPRFNISYLISDDLSVKGSYTRMHQFVHLLSTAVFAIPGDVFYPSTDYVRPETSEQISLGIFSGLNFTDIPNVESSLEVYYKDMKNLPMLRQKYSSPSDDRIRQDVVIGRGWVYGIDAQLAKQSGAFTGWLSYSFLSSWRQFDEKNGGRAFHLSFDRTHQMNVVLNYSFSKKWSAGATFILASGQRVTAPRQKYYMQQQNDPFFSNKEVLDYGDIYSHQLPLYNRLDLSLTDKWEGWGAQWEIFMNLYNVYGYPDPLYILYSSTDGYVQVNLGFIPTVGINFTF